MIGAVSVSSWSACSYNFDVTQATLNSNQPNTKVFPNVSGQKTSFFVEPTNGQTVTYVAVNNNAFTQQSLALVTPPSNGIFVYEYKIKVPLINLSNGEGVSFFPIMASGVNGNNNTQGIVMAYINDSNMNTFVLNDSSGHNGIRFSPSATPSTYQTIGIYVNQDSKQVGYVLNGINKGYVFIYSQNAMGYKFGHTVALNGINSNSSNLGEEISIELVTDHSQITQIYPSGAKDICGNTI